MKSISRRTFLRHSSVSAGLTPLVLASQHFPFVQSLRAGEPPPSEKFRLGLIGSGGMGQGDLECFFLNPVIDCVAICDVGDARSAKGVEICEEKGNKTPVEFKYCL